MLYISRRIGVNEWIVTDTDDGIETKVTLDDLIKIVNLDIEVIGVTRRKNSMNIGRKWSVDKVVVYYPKSHNPSLESKTQLLLGLDVRVVDNEIIAINFVDGFNADRTVVRLSKFARSCGDFIFDVKPSGGPFNKLGEPRKYVFVLDDKIKIKKDTFFSFFNANDIVLDLREVTDFEQATFAYMSWYQSYVYSSFFRKQLLDVPWRMNVFEAYSIIEWGYRDDIDITPEISLKIYEILKPEFERFLSTDLVKPDESHRDSLHEISWYVTLTVSKKEQFWRSNCQDYNKVRKAFDNNHDFGVESVMLNQTFTILTTYLGWDDR